MLESLFNKGLQACNFLKDRLRHRYFPVNISKFLRTTFYRTPLVAAFGYLMMINASFYELLAEMVNETTIHIRNLKVLIEIYKFLNGLSPSIMNEVFQIEYLYNVRNPRILTSRHKYTKKCDIDTIALNFGKIFP